MRSQKGPEKKELKKFLHKRKVSYRKLAEMINISLDALNNKVNGYTEFRPTEIKAIANIFKFSPEEIYQFFIA